MNYQSTGKTLVHPAAPTNEWWRSAVIYQVYPRSFADANGDGIGDLAGIASKLTYLKELGVEAVWISPFYRSPQADAGYDVADYRDIDPVFGTLADADELIREAHELGIRVLIDLVPNHTSDEHAWFERAISAGPGTPEWDWYIFREVDPSAPQTPPNNWTSEFGGPAWSKTPDQKHWYLHLFDSKQPDLNWANPDVRSAFQETLRFWLDHGVDGFRVDVAHGLVKADGMPDFHHTRAELLSGEVDTREAPFYDQEGVHEIYEGWRSVLEEYPGERAMVAEAWVNPLDRLARYVRPREFHQAFNFAFLRSAWDAEQLKSGIENSYRSNDAVGAPTTWVLSNHDVIRHASRFGLPHVHATDPKPGDPCPDWELGLRRARAATTMLMALPGSAYIYQGEELGLPEVLDLPDEYRQDPVFFRTEGQRIGRDGCRVPIPWKKDAPAFGFNDSGASWLPQPQEFGDLAADQQEGIEDSTLELYRRLLRIRKFRRLGEGSLELVDLGPGLVAGDISSPAGSTRFVLNLSEEPWTIPSGAKVLVASNPGVADSLPPDTGVWFEN